MPVYTNSTNDIIFAGDPYIKLAPGDTTTDKYIKDLPTGVTLKSHEPVVSPWTLIAEVTATPMATPADVHAYDNVVVYNASDDVATISANGDDSNAYPLIAGSKEIYSNSERIFGIIEVLSMGTGSVFIYGVR